MDSTCLAETFDSKECIVRKLNSEHLRCNCSKHPTLQSLSNACINSLLTTTKVVDQLNCPYAKRRNRFEQGGVPRKIALCQSNPGTLSYSHVAARYCCWRRLEADASASGPMVEGGKVIYANTPAAGPVCLLGARTPGTGRSVGRSNESARARATKRNCITCIQRTHLRVCVCLCSVRQNILISLEPLPGSLSRSMCVCVCVFRMLVRVHRD